MKNQQTTTRVNKFEQFAVRHPIAFGFVLILLFVLLSTLTWPINQLFPFPEGNEWGGVLAKTIIAFCFIGLLWRFRWLSSAGYRNFGGKRIWIMVIPLIIYKVILSVYVFTGSFTFQFPSLATSLAILAFSLATALLEESMYRGLLLTALRKARGSTHRSLILCAVVSGMFFASNHFVNLLIRPFPVVFFQVVSMTLVGFCYAIFAIYGGSIWPVVLFHWVTNAAVTLALNSIPNFEETLTHWAGYTLILIIPVLASFWLLKPIRRIDERQTTTVSEPV